MRPAKFEFFMSLKTAKRLGIKVPPQRLTVGAALLSRSPRGRSAPKAGRAKKKGGMAELGHNRTSADANLKRC